MLPLDTVTVTRIHSVASITWNLRASPTGRFQKVCRVQVASSSPALPVALCLPAFASASDCRSASPLPLPTRSTLPLCLDPPTPPRPVERDQHLPEARRAEKTGCVRGRVTWIPQRGFYRLTWLQIQDQDVPRHEGKKISAFDVIMLQMSKEPRYRKLLSPRRFLVIAFKDSPQGPGRC